MSPTGSDEMTSPARVYTVEDVLLRMDSKLDALEASVAVIRGDMEVQKSQGLDARLRSLEAMQWKVLGIAAASGAIAGVVAYRLPL